MLVWSKQRLISLQHQWQEKKVLSYGQRVPLLKTVFFDTDAAVALAAKSLEFLTLVSLLFAGNAMSLPVE
jgi:hypothetical protein